MRLYSGFPAAGKTKDFPTPVCMEETVSESASGTCSRTLAWEQISGSCFYLVLTVHTGLFSTAPGCINTHSIPSQKDLSQQQG